MAYLQMCTNREVLKTQKAALEGELVWAQQKGDDVWQAVSLGKRDLYEAREKYMLLLRSSMEVSARSTSSIQD